MKQADWRGASSQKPLYDFLYGSVCVAHIAKTKEKMVQKNSRESYVRSQTQLVDWEAVTYLQDKRRLTKKEFHLDAIEYALDRVLLCPKRKAGGEKLAKDLFRDGKRITASNQGLSGPNLINKQTYFFLEPTKDMQPDIKDRSLLIAIETVRAAFQQLSLKEALALYLRTMGLHSADNIQRVLGTTVRQYRNLYNQSRDKLRSYFGFTEAYFLLYIHSDEADICDFFSHLIDTMYNYKLS